MSTVNYSIATYFPSGLDTSQLRLEYNYDNVFSNVLQGMKTKNGELIITFEDPVSGALDTYLTGTLFPNHEVPDKPSTSSVPVFTSNLYLEKAITKEELYRGSLINTSGLTFQANGIEYIIDNGIYRINDKSITLSAADSTNPRIDLICANILSKLEVVTGTPSSTPMVPVLPRNLVRLSSVTVPAGSTSPSITNTIIYQDNTGTGGGEWNVSTNSGNIDPDSTDNILAGTRSIAFTNAEPGNEITFTSGSVVDIDNFDSLTLGIYLSTIIQTSLIITPLNSGLEAGRNITVSDLVYGYNQERLLEYQQLSIPISDFSIENKLFDGFKITVNGQNTAQSSFHLDRIRLQKGIVAVTDNILTPQYQIGADQTLNTTSDVTFNSVAANSYSGLPVADETTLGIAERATQEEVDEGINTTTFLTPNTFANSSLLDPGETVYFEGYNTINIDTLGTAWVDLDLGAQRIINTEYFTHVLGEPQVTINETGVYKVTSRVTTELISGSVRTESATRILVDTTGTGSSFVEVPASVGANYNRTSNQDKTTATVPVVLSLTSGDLVKVQFRFTAGSNVRVPANFGSMIIQRNKSYRGERGLTGSGSNVHVENDGVIIPTGPFDTINFIGDDVTAVDGGSGTVDVTIGNIPRYYFESDASEVSNGTTTYITALTLTTPTITTGNYEIGFQANWRYSTTAGDCEIRILLDDSTTIGTLITEPQDSSTNQRDLFSGFDFQALTSGIHNVKIQFRSVDSSGTMFLYNKRLKIVGPY